MLQDVRQVALLIAILSASAGESNTDDKSRVVVPVPFASLRFHSHKRVWLLAKQISALPRKSIPNPNLGVPCLV
jgi:hypothetical protein